MHRPASLLVVNPNTSDEVTRNINELARDALGAAALVHTVTARFGFRYIDSRIAISIAAHAVLDVVAHELMAGVKPDAIVVGCFGDPGRDALVEMTGLPVVGFAEAGLMTAAAMPGTFLVATRGQVWSDVIAELVQTSGIGAKVAAITSIDIGEDDPDGIVSFISRRATEVGASRIVLGGAGLIPLMPYAVTASRIPILDPHRAALQKALKSVELSPVPSPVRAVTAEEFNGLSTSLSQLLIRGGTPPPQQM